MLEIELNKVTNKILKELEIEIELYDIKIKELNEDDSNYDFEFLINKLKNEKQELLNRKKVYEDYLLSKGEGDIKDDMYLIKSVEEENEL